MATRKMFHTTGWLRPVWLRLTPNRTRPKATSQTVMLALANAARVVRSFASRSDCRTEGVLSAAAVGSGGDLSSAAPNGPRNQLRIDMGGSVRFAVVGCSFTPRRSSTIRYGCECVVRHIQRNRTKEAGCGRLHSSVVGAERDRRIDANLNHSAKLRFKRARTVLIATPSAPLFRRG